MNTNDSYEGAIRALIYPIQFDGNPLEQVDRIIQQIEAGRILHANAADLLKVIQTALQSDAELSGLIPQPHTESLIRAYLKALAQRLDSSHTQT